MLWWLLDDPRLGFESGRLLASSPCVLSVASIWEVAIKHRQELHHDPCDRLLIAHARYDVSLHRV